VLVLETLYGPAVFSENDLPFLQTIADLIALAIDRAWLADQGRCHPRGSPGREDAF